MKSRSKEKNVCDVYLEKINIVNLKRLIPDIESLDKKTNELKKILNPIRLKILMLTSGQELPVCAIVGILNLDQSLVSHHIATLKKNGFLVEKRVGKFRLYKANKERISSLINSILKFITT